MHLYSLPLIDASAVTGLAHGNFTGANNSEEIVVNHGTSLELFVIEKNSVVSKWKSPMFANIRSIAATPPTVGKSFLIIGSDSGRISVLKFENDKFVKVVSEPFGKTGCRRIVPGQYVAVDPLGSAIMICAVEKQKFIYVRNFANGENFTLLSPIEAHRQNTIVFSCISLYSETNVSTPEFACLEVEYPETGGAASQKKVVVYKVGSSMTAERFKEFVVDDTANLLIQVPTNENATQGGMIVCAQDKLQYIGALEETKPIILDVNIPRRADLPETRSTIIVSSAVCDRKNANTYFLLQSEYGDLFYVEIVHENGTPKSMMCQYFDTVPTGVGMCIGRKKNFLFVASEFGDHNLYRIVSSESTAVSGQFAPRRLHNLRLQETLQSLHPVTQMAVADIASEDRHQIYTACGRGSRSSLRILRHGLAVTELAVTSLPGAPGGVWSLKSKPDAPQHKYLVVAFRDATLVLSVGETVVAAKDSGLNINVTTLAVQVLADGSFIQVHPKGILRVRDGKTVETWDASGGKRIDCASCNAYQIAIVVEGGLIHYFEYSAESARMLSSPKASAQIGNEAKCVDIGELASGRTRVPYLAVGTFNQQVLIYSLNPQSLLKLISSQILPDQAESVCISQESSFEVFTGLKNGVLVQTRIQESNGSIADTNTQFLGPAPVRCMRVTVGEGSEKQTAVIGLCSRPWICFSYHGERRVVPISYNALVGVASFSSEEVGDAIVAVSSHENHGERINSLRILTMEDLSQIFNAQVVPLDYTPRHLLVNSNYLVVVEGDHGVVSGKDQKASDAKLAKLAQTMYAPPAEDVDEEEVPQLNTKQYGLAKAKQAGSWSGLIRIVRDAKTLFKMPLDANEFVTCANFVSMTPGGNKFSANQYKLEETFLVLGIAVGMKLHSQETVEGLIKVFRVVLGGDNSISLQLVNTTVVEQPPRAVVGLFGMCLAGVGQLLRVYELGHSNLLCKGELKCMPTCAIKLFVDGKRIFATDAHESVFVLTFSPADMSLTLLADDTIPRVCTASQILDYNTVAGADKFGNIFVVRLPADVTDISSNSTSNQLIWDQSTSRSAPNKFELSAMYHVGEVVTSMTKSTLVPGRTDALIYMTIMGSLAAMIPIPAKKDIDFFSLLEMHMRSETSIDLVGREHLSYRSAFAPVRNVIDAQLCEQFAKLPADRQSAIASELDRTPSEVLKKLHDIRNSLM